MMRCARRLGIVASASVLAFSLASSAHGGATDPTLDKAWEASGPIEPEALAADELGAVALGGGGEIVVLDASGEQIWRLTIPREGDFGPLAIGGDLIVVPVDNDRYLGIDRVEPGIRWDHLLPGASVATVGTTPDGSTAVALVSDGGVLELVDGASGNVRWTVAVAVADAMVAERAWVINDRVLLAWADDAGSHLRAFASDGGALVWQHDAPEFSSTPAVFAGTVTFAENTRLDRKERMVAEIRSLALADGQQRWARRGRSTSGYWAAISAAAGTDGVALVDIAGRVTVVDPASGRVRWKHTTNLAQVAADPHVVGDVFAMTTYGTGIVLAEMADGAPIYGSVVDEGQTVMTIESSAAVGDSLYLLVSWAWGDAEVWKFEREPA